MQLTRRLLLTSAAAAAGLALMPRRILASTELSFGDASIQTISDGKMVLPADFVMPEGVTPETLGMSLEELGLGGDSYESAINITVLRRGEDVILFDAGSGPDFMPTAGMLPENLDAAGISLEEVTHVIFTHAHPDHIWGVIDDFDEPLFSNARYMMNRVERDFWLSDDAAASLSPERQSFAPGARRRIEILGDRLETFEDGAEVVPGVVARMTAGHSPGHTSFVIDESVIVAGDVATTPLSLAIPDAPAGADQDKEAGAASRVALLADLAETGQSCVFYHMPKGGIGIIKAHGDGYRFVPA